MRRTTNVLLLGSGHDNSSEIQIYLALATGCIYSVESIPYSDSAASALAETKHDVCVIDASPSTRQGLDLVRAVLRINPNSCLIVVAASGDSETDDEFMQAGAMGYLAKSELTMGLLDRTIRYALERRRVQAELLEWITEETTSLSAVIENLPVGVLITDPRQPDNPLVFVNPAFTNITGYAPEEALGRNCRFIGHTNSDIETIEAIRRSIAARTTFKGVILNRRKDGTAFRNSLVICPVHNKNGELIHFVGLMDDVTAHHNAQSALERSQKNFADMVANVPGVIYRAFAHSDGNADFAFVSEGCRELLEMEPDELMANPALLSSLVHPEDKAHYESITQAATTESKPWRWRGRLILASGKVKYVIGQGHPQPQANGDIIWDGCILDATDLVAAEEKAARLAAIVENSNHAILGKTLDGVVTSWNDAAAALYGYTAEEMIGQPIKRIVPASRDGEIQTILERIASGERVQRFETVRLAKDGTSIDVDLTVSPIKDNAGRITGASAIAQDIRQRKEAEAQIDKQIARIQALRNIDMAITGSLDLRVTLNILLDQVTTHLQVDAAAVLLLNPHTHLLEYAAGRGFRTSAVQRTQLRVGEGYAGRASHERTSISVPNLLVDPQAFVRTSLLAGEEFISYCATPLITKGRAEGVLEIFHRAPIGFDADWMGFLDTLAGQAAIAIENADLFVDLQRSNTDLQIAYDCTLEGWSKALDLRDKETEGHSQRVTAGTVTLAKMLGISDSELIHIRRGALLHDIGKMGIPDSILLKPGPLTDDEWVIMKKHPVYAYELLSPIDFLRPALDIPYCHHEKWDGSGYPRAIKGEQIPIGARIFTVIDVWDALRSSRPYRPSWPVARVRDHIKAGSGTHFDPRVVEVFLEANLDDE